MKKAQLNTLPYTCRAIVAEDIELGAMIGYDGSKVVNYKQGMVKAGRALNSVKKDEFVEYTLYKKARKEE